ncbi:MAG TPA: hypothetical protein VIF12_08195, partial [Micavibrio sp.]
VYVSEDDIDGNYTHYRINPDGTKEADPLADEKIAQGKMWGIYSDGKAGYTKIDGTAIDDKTVRSAQEILQAAGTSLQMETRYLQPAKASVNCHDAREAAVNADGELETLQEHVTITDDNAADIFLQIQEKKFNLADKKIDYAIKMANHRGDGEKMDGALKDHQQLLEQRTKFDQFRIEAGALSRDKLNILLEKTYGEEWNAHKMRAGEPIPAASAAPAPATSQPEQKAHYGERNTTHTKSGLNAVNLSATFAPVSAGQGIEIVPQREQAPAAPAVVYRTLPGGPAMCT